MGIAGKLARRLMRLALENLIETAAMRAGTVIGRAVGERVAAHVRPGKIEVIDLTEDDKPKPRRRSKR